MTIAIIAAMQEELAMILRKVSNPQIIEIGDYKFYQGIYHEQPVVVTLCGVGKAAAAGVTGILIGRFQDLEAIIITGLAGALDPTLMLGDIVISNHCIQHDVDARPNCKTRYQVPFSKAIFDSDPNLIKLSEQAVNTFLTSHLHEHIKKDDLALFNIETPRCKVGAIATGDVFITDPAKLEEIRSEIQKTLDVPTIAVDMESAAVMSIAESCHIKAVALRIISDKGINDHYLLFKRTIASQYTAGITDLFIQEFILNKKKTQDKVLSNPTDNPAQALHV